MGLMMISKRRAKKRTSKTATGIIFAAIIAAGGAVYPIAALAQSAGPLVAQPETQSAYTRTTGDYNRHLASLDRDVANHGAEAGAVGAGNYCIGPDDQLDITVLEAPELNGTPRVSQSGDISLPLIGTVKAAGLTTQELQVVVEELLRRRYIKDPHVTVQVRDVQSHPVAVFGAVKKPGVFQIRDPKTVIEILSMAEGLDADAGDKVIVEHRSRDGGGVESSWNSGSAEAPTADDTLAASPRVRAPQMALVSTPPRFAHLSAPEAENDSSTVTIDLKKLLDTGNPALNVLVYPGDVVKVPRADLVYVVGEVGKPGGFELKSNERVSVLQALAMAQGLTHTSAASHARIIRTDPVTNARTEIPINIKKILAGKSADPMLRPRDILFVPNSSERAALYRGVEAAVSIGSGVAVYRW